jgi:hypothetical protein
MTDPISARIAAELNRPATSDESETEIVPHAEPEHESEGVRRLREMQAEQRRDAELDRAYQYAEDQGARGTAARIRLAIEETRDQ